jgi:hypothetical protein
MKHIVRRVSRTGMLAGVLLATQLVGGCGSSSSSTPSSVDAPASTAVEIDTSLSDITAPPPPPDGVYSTEETVDDSFPKLDPAAEALFLELLHTEATATTQRVEGQLRDVPVGGESILSLGRGYCASVRGGETPLHWLTQYSVQAQGRGDYEAVLLAYATAIAATTADSLCPETASQVAASDADMIAVVAAAWAWPNNNKR